MPASRNSSVLKSSATPAQVERAAHALNALKAEKKTWDRVSAGLADKFATAYLWQVGHGKRPPSRRLLLTLGIIKAKPRKPRLTLPLTRSEASEILDWWTFPDAVRQRLLKKVSAYDQRIGSPTS